jgi:hypothetical protein
MKNYLIISALAIILFSACKDKEDLKKEAPISALSIIKGQLKKFDSTIYAFTKYERVGDKTDTAYLRREEVKKIAEIFLSLPEIADEKYHKRYTEEKIVDAEQQTLSITSTLKDGVNSEIQTQMLIIDMADLSNGTISRIFIDSYKNSGDSSIGKKLYWEIDKYFTILTSIEKENQPEKTHYTKIEWQ